MLLEDFIWFPDAQGFPSGPFDLESIEYSDTGCFTLFFRLGFVYDFYLLKFTVLDSVTWELWHLDSAVMHVDEEKEADNPVFQCKPLTISCDMQMPVWMDERQMECRAVRMRMEAENGDFAIRFEFDTGQQMVLTKAGWQGWPRPSVGSSDP